MRFYRYKAKFSGEQESEAAFWYLRISALSMLLTSAYWVDFTDSYYALLVGFIIGLLAYSALSIAKLRKIYYVFYGLVTIFSFIVFVVSLIFSYHYSYTLISVITLAYGTLQLGLAIFCFQVERTVI